MLKNEESSDQLQGLDVDSLFIERVQVNKAYRAHGWFNPHTNSPCHAERILHEKVQVVPKPEKEFAQEKKISQKKLNKNRAQE